VAVDHSKEQLRVAQKAAMTAQGFRPATALFVRSQIIARALAANKGNSARFSFGETPYLNSQNFGLALSRRSQ
jgi:hypothetical protein